MNLVITVCATLTCALRTRRGISLWIFVTSYIIAPTTQHYPESPTTSQKISRHTDSWWIRTSVISPNHMIWVPSSPTWHVSHRISSHGTRCLFLIVLIDSSPQAYNTLNKYPTMHQFVNEMCAHFLISVQNVAMWHMGLVHCEIWDCCTVGFVQHVYMSIPEGSYGMPRCRQFELI